MNILEDDMSEQKSLQLASIDLFSNETIEEVKDIYFPIFSKIRIYGDIISPVFVAKDVQEVLGLKDMHYRGENSNYEWGVDRVKIKIPGVQRDVIALTEGGLYRAICVSNTPEAKNFQKFITVVMKRLRMKGIVTIDDAVNDYKIIIEKQRKELEEKEKELARNNAATDLLNKQMVKHRDFEEHYYGLYADASYDLAVIKKNKEFHESATDEYELETKLKRITERFYKPYEIRLVDQPKVKGEEPEYSIDEFDEETIIPDETMYFIITTKSTRGIYAATVYMEPQLKLDDLKKKMKDHGYPQHGTAWLTTINNIKDVVEDLNVNTYRVRV